MRVSISPEAGAREVGMKRGKTPITKLVDETPPELRRVVQEAQNQITSGV